jgi:hypothetical protein
VSVSAIRTLLGDVMSRNCKDGEEEIKSAQIIKKIPLDTSIKN